MKLFICLLFVSMLVTPVHASDWNMFKKDTSHSGFTTDTINPPLTLKWTFELGFDTDSSPVIVDDVLYIGSNYGIHAIDAKSGKELWKIHTNGFVRAVPSVVDGTLYVGAEDKRFYAVDIKDGSIKWSYESPFKGFTTSAAVVNNVAYVGSQDASLYAINVRTGKPLWNVATLRSIESSPAVSEGRVYFGNNRGIVRALDISTGNEIWSYSTSNIDIRSSPVVANGAVFIGSNDGNVYALTADGGNLKWKFSTKNNVESSPSVKDGTVYFGSRDGRFYAVDAETGIKKWDSPAVGFVDSSPAISKDVIYFGTGNNFIYALDANSGDILWRNSTGTKDKDDITSPAISGNMLFAATDSGKVYAYSGEVTLKPTAIPVRGEPLERTATPTAIPAVTPEARGFEYSLFVLLITVLIGKRILFVREPRK